MRKLTLIVLCLLVYTWTVRATDVTIATTSIPHLQFTGIGINVTGTATVTNGSATVTSAALFPTRLVNLRGYKIVLGGIEYEVATTDSMSSLTLTTNYAGATGAASFTIYPVIALQIYATQPFTPLGANYVVQSGVRGQQTWFVRVGCSIKQIAGVPTLFIPQITLPATSDIAANAERGARWSAWFYRLEGSELRAYDGFQEFALPATPSPTSWAPNIRNYNLPLVARIASNTTYTTDQVNALLAANAGAISATPEVLLKATGAGTAANGSALSQSGTTVTASNNFNVSGSSVIGGNLVTNGTMDGGVPAATYAGLPAAPTTYRRYKLTDKNRGYWNWNVTYSRWEPENGGVFDARNFGLNPAETAANNVSRMNTLLAAAASEPAAVIEINNGNYNVNAAIPLISNIVLRGNATLTQTANNTSIFTITSKSNIVIEGLKFVGVGTDYLEVISDPAQAINATGVVTGLTVDNCTFTNFGNAAVKAKGSRIKLTNLNITGVGTPELTPVTSGACYGIVIESTTDDAYIAGCTITQTSQGIASGQNITNLRIVGNHIYDIIGQHGIYLGGGGMANIDIIGNTVRNVDLIGIKVQVDDAAGVDSSNIVIANNSVEDAGGAGINVTTGVIAGPTYKPHQVVVSGNTIFDEAPDDGINLANVINGVVANNIIVSGDRDGISLIDCQRVKVEGNLIRNGAQNGIKVNLNTTTPDEIEITNNKITNIAQTNTAGARNGIYLRGSTNIRVRLNTITDSSAKMQYGIFVETGTQSTHTVEDNWVEGATDNGARFIAGQALASIKGNYFPQGVLNLPQTNQRGDVGREFYSTAVPSSGAWLQGDIVWNYTPSANGVVAWMNVTAGSPGTWTAIYSNNQATNTTATPTFATVTGTSAVATTIFSGTTNTASEADIGLFTQANAGGFAAIKIDRPGTLRYSLVKHSTTGTNDWLAGVAYGGGGANSDYTIGQTINSADYKLKINSTTGNVGFTTGTATATAGAATLNAQTGTITSEALTTAAGAAYTLTLTNSKIAATAMVFVSFTNGTNSQGILSLGEVTPGSGSATIVIRNIHASQALNGTLKINFMVM